MDESRHMDMMGPGSAGMQVMSGAFKYSKHSEKEMP